MLTQDEVDSLPEGTEVMVLWEGGNGAHKYRIVKWHDLTYAETDFSSANCKHLLNRVGITKWSTRVWLVESEATKSDDDR